jgi:hypothetical protein
MNPLERLTVGHGLRRLSCALGGQDSIKHAQQHQTAAQAEEALAKATERYVSAPPVISAHLRAMITPAAHPPSTLEDAEECMR